MPGPSPARTWCQVSVSACVSPPALPMRVTLPPRVRSGHPTSVSVISVTCIAYTAIAPAHAGVTRHCSSLARRGRSAGLRHSVGRRDGHEGQPDQGRTGPGLTRKEVPVAGGIVPTSLLPVSECPGVRVPEDHVRGRDLLRAIVSCLFCRTLSVHPLAGRDIWQQPKPIRYERVFGKGIRESWPPSEQA